MSDSKMNIGFLSRNKPQLILAAILLVCFSGCASAVVVSGLSTAPSGVSLARGFGSKVISFLIVDYEDSVQATRRAAKALSLQTLKETIGEARSLFRYQDDKGEDILIEVERRTETVTSISVDAGSFSSEGMTRLVLRQIIDELTDAGDLLED
jgi:hypothetical protein